MLFLHFLNFHRAEGERNTRPGDLTGWLAGFYVGARTNGRRIRRCILSSTQSLFLSFFLFLPSPLFSSPRLWLPSLFRRSEAECGWAGQNKTGTVVIVVCSWMLLFALLPFSKACHDSRGAKVFRYGQQLQNSPFCAPSLSPSSSFPLPSHTQPVASPTPFLSSHLHTLPCLPPLPRPVTWGLVGL